MSETTGVEARLLEFLRGGIFSADTEVTVDTDLIASGFDSLSLVALLVFIERTYGMWIPQNEINEKNLANIRAIAAMVARLTDEGKPSS